MIISMYITTLPIIIAGVLNMILVRQQWVKNLAYPIDGYNIHKKDKRRLLGNNKTYIGIATMVLCGILSHVIWGIICENL